MIAIDTLIVAMGIVGFLTFPHEAFAEEREQYIKENCLDESGLDNGMCILEPIGLQGYIIHGAQYIAVETDKAVESTLKQLLEIVS